MPTYRPWVIFKHKNIKFVKYIDDDDDNDDDDDDDDDDELLDIYRFLNFQGPLS